MNQQKDESPQHPPSGWDATWPASRGCPEPPSSSCTGKGGHPGEKSSLSPRMLCLKHRLSPKPTCLLFPRTPRRALAHLTPSDWPPTPRSHTILSRLGSRPSRTTLRNTHSQAAGWAGNPTCTHVQNAALVTTAATQGTGPSSLGCRLPQGQPGCPNREARVAC